MSDAEQALDAREARNNALEEAARVCDEEEALHERMRYYESMLTLRRAAARIRALKSQEPSRLFAAAPALLEALEQAEECLRYASSTFNASNFTDRHGMGPKFRKALQATVAAIAAAKGE